MGKNHEYMDGLLNQSLSRMQQDLPLWYAYCLRPAQVVPTASRMKTMGSFVAKLYFVLRTL